MSDIKKSYVAISTRTYENYNIICPHCCKLIQGDENFKNILKIRCPECGKDIDIEYDENFKNINATDMKTVNQFIDEVYVKLMWYETELNLSNSLMRKSYLDGRIEVLKWILTTLKLETFED